MKNDILLVGVGQLGSRYLQSLKAVKSSLNIYIVDINQSSLDLAKKKME